MSDLDPRDLEPGSGFSGADVSGFNSGCGKVLREAETWSATPLKNQVLRDLPALSPLSAPAPTPDPTQPSPAEGSH